MKEDEPQRRFGVRGFIRFLSFRERQRSPKKAALKRRTPKGARLSHVLFKKNSRREKSSPTAASSS
jgi:hypothetical protein